ncbi:cAMP-dependent protein kinase inhibitor gamma isoform X1 [Pungitius pungitius]|uniref:cAMP-dependent protein kinase inhibitor gamma isoform X1 n=1 Tax=Pungitius pungitius TaxID=134920 RepID=UPI002E14DC65
MNDQWELYLLSAQAFPFQWCNESSGHGQMMDVETSYSDFINCDRTGRRNAVPDLAGKGEGEGAASTSELAKDLAEMDLKAAECQVVPVRPLCVAFLFMPTSFIYKDMFSMTWYPILQL